MPAMKREENSRNLSDTQPTAINSGVDEGVAAARFSRGRPSSWERELKRLRLLSLEWLGLLCNEHS